jgi:tetratricopeptide (TPR) repeat protein
MNTYRTLLSRFPNQHDAYLPLARLLRDQQRPHDALRAYRAFIDSTSRPPPRVYTEMLELYKQTGATDGLEQVLKRLVERQQDAQSYQRRLGRLYVEQERYAEALPIYEALLRRQPDDPRLLSRLQRLYEKTGHAPPDNFGRSAELDNASPARLQSRAHALYETARQADAPLDSAAVAPARRLLRQALDRDPTHVPSLALLGTLTLELGAPAEAAALFQRAIDEDPRAPDRWAKLATAHRRAGHLQRAINAAEEGLLLFPGRPALLRSLALARLQRGEYNAALSRFQQALDKVDSTPQTDALRAALLAGRGRAHDRLNQTENAVADYESALRLDPEQLTALRHLAFHLVRSNPDSPRARQLAQRAVNAFPTHPRALDTLGWVSFKQGDLAAARTHLENALDTGSAPAVVYDHFADVLRALGNDRRAREYRQKALERAPARGSIRQKQQSSPPR